MLKTCWQAATKPIPICQLAVQTRLPRLNWRCRVKTRVYLFSLSQLAGGSQAIQRRQMSQMQLRTVLSTTRTYGSRYQLMNCCGQLSTQR